MRWGLRSAKYVTKDSCAEQNREAGAAAQTNAIHNENLWRAAKFAEPQAPPLYLDTHLQRCTFREIQVWYLLRKGDIEISLT